VNKLPRRKRTGYWDQSNRMSHSFTCMFTFTSTSTTGRNRFDRHVPRRLNHLTAAVNVSSATIVNVRVLVTVNVNGHESFP
jgi:hypothetical protein